MIMSLRAIRTDVMKIVHGALLCALGLVCALGLIGCVHLPDTAHSDRAAEVAIGPINEATPLAAVISRDHVEPLDPAAGTSLLDQAMAELAKTDRGNRFRGVTYDLTKDNNLDRDWLVQTPHVWGRRASTIRSFPLDCHGRCDADFRLPFCRSNADCGGGGAVCGHLQAFDASPELAGRLLCLGHSDAVIDRFYQPIIGAQAAVDITVLQPVPDYRFLAALRNAVTMLARSQRAVTIRILVGQYPPDNADPRALLAELVRDANAVPGARLTVYAGAVRSCSGTPSCGSASWNHAKIVAVDGRTALVGGHNMWSEDYLVARPVHDVSMLVHGGAAIDAHHYADRLWDYVCDHRRGLAAVSSFVYRSGSTAIESGCLETIHPPPAALDAKPGGAKPGVTVLATGRLGAGMTDHFGNQDDLARDLVFGAARHDIVAAQQDVAFGMPGKAAPIYPELTLKAWAEFMLAGRGDVFLVLSNLGAKGHGPNDYSNGVPLRAVAEKMLAVAQAHSSLSRPALVDLLCRHFHLAPFRFGPDASWSRDAAIGNHAKFWMVDDRYFYIGSDNLYPVDLQEFGYIVDDGAAAAELRRAYWDPLWRWSRAAAISGADAPGCVLRSENPA